MSNKNKKKKQSPMQVFHCPPAVPQHQQSAIKSPAINTSPSVVPEKPVSEAKAAYEKRIVKKRSPWWKRIFMLP